MQADSTTAIVAYHGVLVDETEVFRFVLSRLPGFRTVTVGVARGRAAGPGGVQTVEATLNEVGNPEIIAVPGGIGCHRRSEIGAWLRSVSPRWMLASSTGSALLATAGLLRDTTAATHWLAGPILQQHGTRPSPESMVVNGAIITCSGGASAFRAALVVADAYGGAELVARIRTDAAGVRGHATPPRDNRFWARIRGIARGRNRTPPENDPLERALTDLDVLDLGMVSPPPDRRPDVS